MNSYLLDIYRRKCEAMRMRSFTDKDTAMAAYYYYYLKMIYAESSLSC
jgi:hypothetical protein